MARKKTKGPLRKIEEIENRIAIAAEMLRLQREQQKRLDLALDLAGVGMWDWEPASNKLTWDERMCELFDEPVDSTKTYETFFNKVHSEDQAEVQSAIDAALAGETYDITYRILSDGRCCKWIHARGLLHKNGGPPKLIGVCVELSDRCEH